MSERNAIIAANNNKHARERAAMERQQEKLQARAAAAGFHSKQRQPCAGRLKCHATPCMLLAWAPCLIPHSILHIHPRRRRRAGCRRRRPR